MVLEVTDIISSGGELATAPPKKGDDFPSQSPAGPKSSTAPSLVVESRDVPCSSDVSTSSSMRMYADELTAAEQNSKAEELLGFSPTNEHRDEPVCGSYFDSTSSDVKRVSSTLNDPSTGEGQEDDNNEIAHEKVAVAIASDVSEIEEEAVCDPTPTTVMEETLVEKEVVEENTIGEDSIATELEEEKPVEEVVEDAQEADAQVTERIPDEQVFLETSPDFIEASSSKADQLETEQNDAEPETTNKEGKKNRASLLSKPNLSRASLLNTITLTSSRVGKSFTNTLSSLSKPSVPKASLRKMAKLPKMEKLPSVSKLSSSVAVAGSLISKRSPSLSMSQRSLPRLPKKLSKPSFGKKFKKTETAMPEEHEADKATATLEETNTVPMEPTEINSTWLKTELENTISLDTKIAEVEAPSVTEVPDTIPEEPPQRNYFEELLDQFDLLCAPMCKGIINQPETIRSLQAASGSNNENSQLVITTNPTETSFLDGIKSLCSIATEHSFFGEEKPVVQEAESGKLEQTALTMAKEEPDKLDVAAVMAKEALDKETFVEALDKETFVAEDIRGEAKGVKSMFSFRRSNIQKDKSTKPSLKIFAPSVSSVKKVTDMKNVSGQSLRRLMNRKQAGQAPSNEVAESLVLDIQVSPNSQSLDEVQATSLSCVDEKPHDDAAALKEMAPKQDKSIEPAGKSCPDAEALLELIESEAPKEEAPSESADQVFTDAESLLGRSRSSL